MKSKKRRKFIYTKQNAYDILIKQNIYIYMKDEKKTLVNTNLELKS